MPRMIMTLLLSLFLAVPLAAQDEVKTPQPDRSATGGAQTLEDILARQRGEPVDNSFRRDATGGDDAAGMAGQLGTLGGRSDPDVWRALRYGLADVTVSSGGAESRVLIQDRGMWWLQFREGPLRQYGAWVLAGTLAVLALFYMIRGRIRIDGEKTGRTVTRFQAMERFGHWLLAGSFLVLGLTGLVLLFGRKVIIPAFGHDSFATVAQASKWVHNNISWAFMLALVMIFAMWVMHNLPSRTDLKWLAVGGGIFRKGVHPPAKKFNAGQKLIFWSVILLGGSISVSGLALLFPFELPMFAKTFELLNQTGAPQALGLGTLPETLAPHEEMQFSQLWHAIVSFGLIAIILAHIYIGSVGMEGAYDAMGSGEVEEQWAREHHSLWLQDLQEKGHARAPGSGPEGAIGKAQPPAE